MLSEPRNLLKTNATALEQLLRLADPVIVVVAGWVARWWYLGTSEAAPTYWVAMLFGLRLSLRFMRRRGYNLRHVCIVGAGELGREVALRLRRAPWSGLSLRGFFDDAPELANTTVEGIPVLGTIDSLNNYLEHN